MNGEPIANPGELSAARMRVRIGDTVRVEVRRPQGTFRATVVVAGYESPRVHVEELPGATSAQRQRRDRWIQALP